MYEVDVVRAWKDPHYRRSLSDEAKGLLPQNPAGLSYLSDEELRLVVGGLPICSCSPSAITSVTIHPSCPDCV
jgi:mersacidin/lichenicidin family type 2 lantibiotic